MYFTCHGVFHGLYLDLNLCLHLVCCWWRILVEGSLIVYGYTVWCHTEVALENYFLFVNSNGYTRFSACGIYSCFSRDSDSGVRGMEAGSGGIFVNATSTPSPLLFCYAQVQIFVAFFIHRGYESWCRKVQVIIMLFLDRAARFVISLFMSQEIKSMR